MNKLNKTHLPSVMGGDEISLYLKDSFYTRDNSRWSYYLVYEDKKTGLKIIRFKRAGK